jgi:hypothetical protein
MHQSLSFTNRDALLVNVRLFRQPLGGSEHRAPVL